MPKAVDCHGFLHLSETVDVELTKQLQYLSDEAVEFGVLEEARKEFFG